MKALANMRALINLKALLAVLVALSLAFLAFVPAQAHAAKDPYKYTVRLYSGAQGSFTDGTDCIIYSNLTPGSQLSFHQGDVKLDDNTKYYVRGWKVSGRDNDTTSELLASLTVTSDLDLVVSYGILGDNVGYTVRYVDAAGNELFPTESFYGNVGESPMLAYRYIEGYLPQAYNLTGELLADASQNVYTFTYEPLTAPEDITIVTPATPVTPTAPATTPTTPAADAPTTPVAAEDAPATALEAPEGTTIADEANPLTDTPATVQDIRDNETPLASAGGMYLGSEPGAPIGEEASLVANLPLPAIIGSIAGIVVLALAIILIVRGRKKQHAETMRQARAAMAGARAQRPAAYYGTRAANIQGNSGYTTYGSGSINESTNAYTQSGYTTAGSAGYGSQNVQGAQSAGMGGTQPSGQAYDSSGTYGGSR